MQTKIANNLKDLSNLSINYIWFLVLYLTVHKPLYVSLAENLEYENIEIGNLRGKERGKV